jgi:hypothetical protein
MAGEDAPACRGAVGRLSRTRENAAENDDDSDRAQAAHFLRLYGQIWGAAPGRIGRHDRKGAFAVEEKRTTLTDEEILTSTPGDIRQRHSVTDADQDDETDASDSDTDGTDSDSDGTDT